MNKQPEALRLANLLEQIDGQHWQVQDSAAAELRRLHQHEVAANTWLDKTNWVQETARPCELGMHRADVMRARLTEAEGQRDALLGALHSISLAAQDSGSTREGMGLYARAAIAKAEGQQ